MIPPGVGLGRLRAVTDWRGRDSGVVSVGVADVSAAAPRGDSGLRYCEQHDSAVVVYDVLVHRECPLCALQRGAARCSACCVRSVLPELTEEGR